MMEDFEELSASLTEPGVMHDGVVDMDEVCK